MSTAAVASEEEARQGGDGLWPSRESWAGSEKEWQAAGVACLGCGELLAPWQEWELGEAGRETAAMGSARGESPRGPGACLSKSQDWVGLARGG